MSDKGTKTDPPRGGAERGNNMPGGGGTSAGQTQPISGDAIAGAPLAPGGMRGIGLLAFMLAQIVLKLETLEIAKDYLRTNKRDFDFFRATHQPGMAQSVSEVMSETLNPQMHTDLYASAPAGLSTSKAIDQKWFAIRRSANRYNVGVHHKVDYEFAVARTAAVVSGWNMGRRYELAWAEAHNDRTYNRKMAMANVGIQAGNTMREGLATAVGGLQQAYTNIGDIAATAANGLYGKQAYDDARSTTRAMYDRASGEVTGAAGKKTTPSIGTGPE